MEVLSYLSSALQKENGKTYLPDARRKFLRMNNNGAMGPEVDPDNRELGSKQKDSADPHQHNFIGPIDKRGHPHGSGDTNKYSKVHQSYWRGNKQAEANTKTQLNRGIETRPKNISVNFFVRVSKTNRECSNG